MKGRILGFGSIVAVVILVLASFPSVVGVRTSDLRDRSQQVRERIKKDEWYPGAFIFYLLYLTYDISQYFYEQTGWFCPLLSLLGAIVEAFTTITVLILIFIYIFFIWPLIIPDDYQFPM